MKKTSRQPVLIFDFDGTIADTLSLLINISNQLSEEFHFKKIDSADLDILKNKNIMEIIQHLKVPIHQIPLITYKTRQLMRQHITEAPITKDLKDILSQMKSEGRKMGVLTSNSHKNVQIFLKHNDIECFDFFHASVGVFGKKQRLKKLLREQKLSGRDAIYIGDEIRDIEAAKSSGIKIASVAWGYNHADILAQHAPDYLFYHPKDLLTLFSD